MEDAGVAVLVERLDDRRRTEQALLVDRDDFRDALGTVGRNRRNRRVRHGVVRRQTRQNLVVLRESTRKLVEDAGRELLGARRKKNALG